MKIAFLGPEASFTQLTATQLFPNEELIPKANILDCFLAVQNNEVDKAVVPLENSIEGTVFYDFGLSLSDAGNPSGSGSGNANCAPFDDSSKSRK